MNKDQVVEAWKKNYKKLFAALCNKLTNSENICTIIQKLNSFLVHSQRFSGSSSRKITSSYKLRQKRKFTLLSTY